MPHTLRYLRRAGLARTAQCKLDSADADEQATAHIQGPDLSRYRPLTSEEKAFLTYLLQHAMPDATAFLPQLEDLRALPNCTCGCPSISLCVAPEHSPASYPGRFVADQIGGAPDFPVGVLLFQAGGKLTELEIYAFADITGPFSLPPVETLRLFETGVS